MRYTNTGAALDQSLVYATWAAGSAGANGTWAPFAAVSTGVTTLEVPGITTSGSSVLVAFLGTNNDHYFTSFTAGAWSSVAAVEPTAGSQASGPTPGGIAAVAGDATIAYFANTTNQATSQELTTSWQVPVTIDTNASDESYVATPSIVALNGGAAELLVAFIRQSDGEILFATQTGGAWSTPAAIPGATAPSATSYGPVERVGLAALPNGGAILAWRDRTTSGIFYSLYSGTWSAAPIAFSTPNITLSAAPAVAHGVAGATAEMAFVGSSGAAFHARLIGGTWTTPVMVGGTTLSHVAIASGP
jgi:hypothetical protein